MSKIVRIFYFMLGAAFTQVSGPYTQHIWDAGYDMWCGGSASLALGKVALAKAIKEDRPELFKNAKDALENSAACQVSGESQFLLGLVFCQGLGVEKDVPHGRRLLREAIGRQPKWAIEILANPKLCRANE
jgi:hypothetical protein